MKTLKYLTMASIVPLLWVSSAEAQAKDKTQASSQKAELQYIEPCLEPYNKQGDVSINRLPPPDECDGGGDPGPYLPPGTPTSIESPVYTNDDNYRVIWTPGYGHGYPVRNELYVQTNSGSWSKVYDGYGSSKYFSNLGKTIKRHRVRSCNTKGCSSFRYSNKTMVNHSPKPNLYNKYNFLSTLDQTNADYKATAQSFKSALAREEVVGQGSLSLQSGMTINGADDRFYLGDGYDLVRGSLKEVCLDVEHPDFQITQTAPLQPSTFSVDYVQNNSHLAELLEVSSSAKVGFSGDDFSLGLSGEKERYVKSVTDEQYVRFVVKVKNRRQFWKLNTPTDAIYPELVNQVLSPNDEEAKADFRERCGDNFVSSANLGSALYLVFSFNSKKYSYQEREQKKGELGAAITKAFSIGGATSSNYEFEQTLDNLNVSINADQVGGPLGIAASITPDNVISKYNQFVQNTNADNWAAVDFDTSNYQRPTVYNAYTHQQIFADYRGNQGILAQMKRWADISVQLKERCMALNEYGESRSNLSFIQTATSNCGAAEQEISVAMDACRDTREWEHCSHPVSYSTSNLSNFSGTNLLGWLNANIKRFDEATAVETYDHHVHKGEISVDDNTCLPTNMCIGNHFKGSGKGAGQGFKVITYEYDNPKGSRPQYSTTYPSHCVNSTAFLKTGGFLGDTTADWHYKMEFQGVCAETQNFSIVQ